MQHLHVTVISRDPLSMTRLIWENLPIQYALTDQGRAYLAELRVEEIAAEGRAEGQGSESRSRRVHDGEHLSSVEDVSSGG